MSLNFSSTVFQILFRCTIIIVVFQGHQSLSLGAETELLHIRLDPRPFSPALCHSTGVNKTIRIQVAKHRDLIIRQAPGQFIPSTSGEARINDYVHYITLDDITDGVITTGSIAFDRKHAVIFTPEYPDGRARNKFIRALPESKQRLGQAALNTFLRLRPALLAGIDACRSYPPYTIYGTDEEIDKIESARRTFSIRIHGFNSDATASSVIALHKSGINDGFIDPNAGEGKNVSYQPLNPLNFYVPITYA